MYLKVLKHKAKFNYSIFYGPLRNVKAKFLLGKHKVFCTALSVPIHDRDAEEELGV